MRHLMRMTCLLSGLLLWPGLSAGGPGDLVQTLSKVIREVQIQISPTGTVYYFVAEGGWQAANCAGLLYPYVAENAPGAKAIFATALASKTTQSPITFTGVCGDPVGDTRYMQIRFATF